METEKTIVMHYAIEAIKRAANYCLESKLANTARELRELAVKAEYEYRALKHI